MMERVRILVVATPTAPVRGLAARLRDPDVDVLVSGSAREALERVGPAMPNVIIIDGSLPGRDVFRMYGRVRAMPDGATIPIIFSAHERSDAEAAATTAPDFYLGPDATLDDVEQLVYTFLPESLVETDEPPPLSEVDQLAQALAGHSTRSQPATAPLPPTPTTWAGLGESLSTGVAPIALAYLGIYAVSEILAAAVDPRLGLTVHAGLLVALFFHGANVPPGPERTLFWAVWLAPLTRIYGLAQPYAGGSASPLTWLALTAVPMVVAGVVALKLSGLTAREAGLIPSPRDVPVAAFLVPVGLALGVLVYMLLEPRGLARDLASANVVLVALIVIANPGLVDELVFRGVMQRASLGVLGTGLGIAFTSLLYAPIVPAGLASGSLTAVSVTFVIGLLLSQLTARTGSILSAAVAHASLAVGLFVIAPYWVPGGLGLTGGATTTPAVTEMRPPATRPITIISGSPTLVPAPPPGATSAGTTSSGPAGLPAATGQPALPGLPGLATPGQPASKPTPPDQAVSTPVGLAPPLPPPTQAPPTAESSPAPGGAASPIVVVRGTGGAGARLRSQPGNNGPIITVVPEYTPLVIVGADRQADGIVWRNVRTPSGQDGWVAASFVTTGQ